MSEPKKRLFSLELTDEETAAFIEMCYRDGTSPLEVLGNFICDLTLTDRSNGSDERELARSYYDRCGYGYFFQGDYRSFAQWLLSVYGESSLTNIIDSLDTIESLQEEIEACRDEESPDITVIDDLEKEIKAEEKAIGEYYQEYVKVTEKPEPLKEGIEGIRAFLEMVRRSKEGEVI